MEPWLCVSREGDTGPRVMDGWSTGVPRGETRRGWRIRLIAKSGPPKFKLRLGKVDQWVCATAGL